MLVVWWIGLGVSILMALGIGGMSKGGDPDPDNTPPSQRGDE